MAGRLRIAIACGVLIALAVPAVVWAQCGGLYTQDAHKDVGRGRAPLAIGDSVMRLPAERLAEIGYRVNYSDCRGWDEGLGVIREEEGKGRLGHLVVMAVGSDFGLSIDRVRQALKLLGSKHGEKRVLAIVTTNEPGAEGDAEVARRAGHKFKHRVKILDWEAKADGHPEWFIADGFHPNFAGADAYVELFKQGLRYASWPKRRPNLNYAASE